MKKLMTLSLMIMFTLLLASCGTTDLINQNLLTTETLPIYTLEDISSYTGENGSTAYIIVDDVVYDVTDAFDNGKHQGIQVGGTDATSLFSASPHSASLLETLPIVGIISNGISPTTNNDVTNNNPASSTETLPVFTLDELSQYTGANGSTAYIAVNGVIYDVTNEFNNGQHQGMQLGGTDATAAFASSPHSASFLSSLTVVGSLEGSDPIVIDLPSTETLPVFTLDELSQYTGANGSTAYIAVNGVIYDVTNEFNNGQHQGMQLGGTDATAAFASSPHSASFLSSLTVVGSLEGSDPILVTDVITQPNYNNDDDHDDDYDDDHDDDHDDDYDDDDDDHDDD